MISKIRFKVNKVDCILVFFKKHSILVIVYVFKFFKPLLESQFIVIIIDVDILRVNENIFAKGFDR